MIEIQALINMVYNIVIVLQLQVAHLILPMLFYLQIVYVFLLSLFSAGLFGIFTHHIQKAIRFYVAANRENDTCFWNGLVMGLADCVN